MAMQRCVWSCLANSPGASSWQYNQCVQQRCAGIGENPVPAQTGPWRNGVASDGFSQFAGVEAEGRSDLGLYYFCNRTRASYLALFGLDGDGGLITLQIDQSAYALNFTRSGAALRFDLPPRSPFLDVLSRGRQVVLTNALGAELFRAPLGGATLALGKARTACGL